MLTLKQSVHFEFCEQGNSPKESFCSNVDEPLDSITGDFLNWLINCGMFTKDSEWQIFRMSTRTMKRPDFEDVLKIGK
jgi:hypothetical protein